MKTHFSLSASLAISLALVGCGEPASSADGSGGQAGSSTGGLGTGGSGAGGSSTAGSSTGGGATSWPEGDQRAYTIDVGGTQRKYIVTIPADYDPNHPYRLVLTWHGRGGTAEQIASGFGGSGYYGLAGRIGDSTILVSGQGLGTDSDPEDTGYCIDQDRIFSTGMSYGGIMSITIGCQMSDVFRGIAPIAGALFGGPGGSCAPGPIAVWQTHGSADDVVMIDGGERARDAFLAGNHCGTTTQAVSPEPCVSYEGCDDGFPVVWCVHDGGHTIPSFSSDAIAAFFGRF
jgi:polyhydroxybutyrate depolymerase